MPMRFLLRLAFWLGVVAILLPGSQTERASHAQIKASEALSATRGAVDDMLQFCDRQPDACTVGSQAAPALGVRAKAGAQKIYDFLNDRLASSETDSVTTRGATMIPLPPPRPSQQTLTPADLVPAWQAPPPRKDVRARSAPAT
jgi:Family of unknown function (DUF5330)